MLRSTAGEVAERYPEIQVTAVCADYLSGFHLSEAELSDRRTNVLFFPGSSIGNYTREKAGQVLAQFRKIVGPAGKLLIGVDLLKDTDILIPAYSDAAGVTAAFSLNVLDRLRRELGSDVDPRLFRHKAYFNAEAGCIEMRLLATEDLSFSVGDATYTMNEGDHIHTESSHKYRLEDFQAIASHAGFGNPRVWTDRNGYFSVQLFDAV
jgi:dimethylhistidine N-methyltransferase